MHPSIPLRWLTTMSATPCAEGRGGGDARRARESCGVEASASASTFSEGQNGHARLFQQQGWAGRKMGGAWVANRRIEWAAGSEMSHVRDILFVGSIHPIQPSSCHDAAPRGARLGSTSTGTMGDGPLWRHEAFQVQSKHRRSRAVPVLGLTIGRVRAFPGVVGTAARRRGGCSGAPAPSEAERKSRFAGSCFFGVWGTYLMPPTGDGCERWLLSWHGTGCGKGTVLASEWLFRRRVLRTQAHRRNGRGSLTPPGLCWLSDEPPLQLTSIVHIAVPRFKYRREALHPVSF